MKLTNSRATRAALLAASSFSVLALATPASAQTADQLNASDALRAMVESSTAFRLGNLPVADYDIIANHTVTPGPGNPATGANYANSPQLLSSGVNGVGQQIALEFPFLGLCTGTLINPRTVITAAHCVFDNPAHMYGSVTGTGGGVPAGQGLPTSVGIPISFGFESTNRCRGVAVNGCATNTGPYELWRDSGYHTQVNRHIYNGNQVWYHPSSGEFGLADIALVTLDTHAQNVPTWTLLFSPLTGPTHVTITGYGTAGVGLSGIGGAAGIDYRRRAAENVVDGLMSSADWAHTPAIAGPDFHDFDFYAHSLYWYDFDDPDWSVENALSNPNFFNDTAPGAADNGYYDFNGFGGTALPNEGSTGGGDSGGPLIVDQRFDRPVVAGVLTGSWSFGGNDYYGEHIVYPPLYLYWQDIVSNNPYKYVSALAGDGDWLDPAHWVQDMDPNYAIAAGDSLVNTLPDVAQLNQDSDAGRWGTVCFLEDSCGTVTGSAYPTGGGNYIVTAGGPGSTNFVPNNQEPVNSANAANQRWARYYDVTLREAGKTTLSGNATIDKLTVTGAAKLNIATGGTLNVWADYTQNGGWTNIDGTLNADEAFVAAGILSGRGLFNPTFLTVATGAVAPGGGDRVGNFTVQADMILASGSSLFIDARRGSADRLTIVGDGAADDNTLTLSENATTHARPAVVFNKVTDAPAPRDGESYIIATADGGISGTFGTVYTFQGVLRPELTYGANTVTATLRAGSLVEVLDGGNATEIAFANALDQLRTGFYDRLWNLYGNVDWMNGSQLAMTFDSLVPKIVGETQLLQDRQSRQLLGNVSDRLSLLGTGRASGISYVGTSSALAQNRDGLSASAQLGLASGGKSMSLPAANGLSGFVAVGGDNVRSSYGSANQIDAGQRSRYFASGIEAPFGDAMIGTAIGYAEATTNAGSDDAKSKVTQAAAYASLPIGKSAYVGGFLAAERASTDVSRLATDTTSMFRLSGATHSSRYMATAEAGFRTGIGHGLSLNPRAQLGYSRYSLSGFREQGGETALELNDLTVNRIESRVGARLDGTAKLGKWALRPQVQADYVRLLSGAKTGMSVSFAAAPEYDFMLPLTNSGSGWMEVKGGVELSRGAFTLGLSGQATAGDAPISDQRGAIDLTFKF